MKAFKVNKLMEGIRRRTDRGDTTTTTPATTDEPEAPEAIATRSVKQFCEADTSQGDEVLFLPPIVEAAESSPTAAAACARSLRHYLSKDYAARPSLQYNAIMLLRILVDNPGETFTRNLDRKFADIVKELLRTTRNDSVRTLMMDALDYFERERSWDQGLVPAIEVWKRERGRAFKAYGHQNPPQRSHSQHSITVPPNAAAMAPPPPLPQNTPHRSSRRLPSPGELASRLEEARTSAKLLTQFVANAPASEMLTDDLVREFADRCQNALRNVQSYMRADDPPPDNDTMESMIDTSEQLQTALNQHQRAVLSARKQLGDQQNTNTTQKPSPPKSSTQKSSEMQGALAVPSTSATAPDMPSPLTPDSGSSPRDISQWRQSVADAYSGESSSKGKSAYVSPIIPAPATNPPSPQSEDPFRDPDVPSASASAYEYQGPSASGPSGAHRSQSTSGPSGAHRVEASGSGHRSNSVAEGGGSTAMAAAAAATYGNSPLRQHPVGEDLYN